MLELDCVSIPRLTAMKTLTFFVFAVMLFAAGTLSAPRVQAQGPDSIIAKGDPPLTESIAGKFFGLLQWTLDVQFSRDQTGQILQILISDWQANKRTEIDTVLELAKLADGLSKASEADRLRAKQVLFSEIVKGFQQEPNDPMNRVLMQAYQSKQAGAPGGAQPRTTTKDTSRIGSDSLSGIYIGVYNPSPGAAINSVQTAFVTFFADGHVYWSLPAEGLLYFDPRVAQRAHPDDWGTYRVVGREISVSLGPNSLKRVFVKEGEKLKLQNYEGQFRASQSYTFTRLANADGLKLEGTYRRYAEAPGIAFSNDGRFRDEGFTRNFGTIGRPDRSTYEDDGRGGTGNYRIEQNTLELRYSDGRVKRFAFTIPADRITDRPIRSFRINYEVFSLD
jgi:hypothetical protein